MKTIHRGMAFLGCAALLAACSVPVGDEGVEETAFEEAPGVETETACTDACYNEYYDCSYYCDMTYSWYYPDIPNWTACLNVCDGGLNGCLAGNWVKRANGNLICQVDPDLHIDGTDIEIYTADPYMDLSCHQWPDRYKKRLVKTVHCSLTTSQSACKTKVTNAIVDLVNQGYIPIVTESDGDADRCPTPRL